MHKNMIIETNLKEEKGFYNTNKDLKQEQQKDTINISQEDIASPHRFNDNIYSHSKYLKNTDTQ